MAIINVKESGEGLEGEIGAEDASAVRTFTVLFDNADDPIYRPQMAWSHSNIPSIYDSYPGQSWLIVRNKRVDRIGDFFFRVTVYYTVRSSRGSEDKFDPLQSPLEQPWDIEWSFAVVNESIDRDINGNPILNSAGESPDPPMTKDFVDLVLSIRRNQLFYNSIQAYQYITALNSDTFYGFVPEFVRCVDFSARSARAGNLWYWQVSYQFQIRKDGWKRRVLDEGFREYQDIDEYGKPIYEIIKDKDGQPVSQPVLLDGAGKKKTQASNAVFLEFDVDWKLPFSVLGL